MKKLILSAVIGILFLSAITSTQGRSFTLTNNFQNQDQQNTKQDSSTSKSAPKKKGIRKKSNSIKSIAVGDSSTQYRKANTEGNKTIKSDTEKQKQPNTTKSVSPK